MENMKNIGNKLPSNAAGRLARTVLLGGAAVYGITNSLFNVEGGHRAIVFNRFGGLKDKARQLQQTIGFLPFLPSAVFLCCCRP